MCSITPETANVGSSYNRMRGPGIGCWFSDRSNCSHWSLTLTLTSYIPIYYIYWSLYNYAAHAARDSNYCRTRCRQSQLRFVLSPLLLHPRLLGTFQYCTKGKFCFVFCFGILSDSICAFVIDMYFFTILCFDWLILGLRPANEGRRYFVATSLIRWAQT